MHLAEKKFTPFFENYFFDSGPSGDCQLSDPDGKLARPNVRPAFTHLTPASHSRFRLNPARLKPLHSTQIRFCYLEFDIYQSLLMEL